MASDLLILVLIWSVSVCLCQRDCSGVKCPELSNCLDEVLDPGACCAKCVQTGCMCEGYQYYDCLSAGFRNGKVPEGESYFVDFGSTECSCPQGGGRISCHFIPCPEIPANCIEMSEPADGCIQCGRVGCVHEEQKYDAGHSFQIEPCQVCHCPNDGGSLMCYPIPDCDPSQVPKTMLMTPGSTEDNQAARHRDPRQHVLHGQIPRIPFTKHLPDLHRDSDRSFKPHQSHSVGDEENDEDYDYPPTDSPAESSIIPLSDSDNFSPWQAVHKPAKQELRERFAIHRSTTDRPRLPFHKDAVERMSVDVHRDKARNEKFGALKFKTNSEPFVYPVEATNRVGFSARQDEVQSFSLYKENSEQDDNEQLELSEETADGGLDVSQEDTTYSEAATDSPMSAELTTSPFWKTTSSWQARWDQEARSQIQSHLPNTLETDTSKEDAEDKVDEGEPDAAPKEPIDAAQPITEEQENVLINSGLSVSHTNETSSEHKASQSFEEPEMVSVDRSESVTLLDLQPFGSESWQHHASTEKNYDWQFFTSPAPVIPSHSLINMREEPEKNSSRPLIVGSEEGLMENCCMAGQKWAEKNQHCDQMPGQTEDLNSVCLVVQQQCCSGALRENKCQAGINMAKSGLECEETSPNCGEDSRKDCCSCCALGLRLQREGEGCHLHQHLSYPCGHVFLICCEEGEEGLAPPKLQKKPRPAPTLLPKRESDRQLLRQALSVGDVDPAANSLEDLESVDRCQRFAALCHHTCINTPDSYRCSCHPGFKLLQDARTCVPENQEEDNRVGEEDGLITEDPTNQESPTEAPVRHYPCAGNGPCSHHCSEVRGQAQCSCFPGFSLAADKHTCEDVNECVTDAQPCQANQRCVNTVGAFVCERQASCPSGYQRRNGACEDIDECLIHTHTCKMGFQCQNTDGSFMCKPKQQCLAGFSKDLHGNCIDVDECDSLSEPCTTGFNCINTVGSYTCQRKIITCGRGYHSSPDGARCIDVDECQTGSHRCGEGQKCHNLPGSHRCDCHSGYQYDAIRKLCVDVNECWRYPGRLCAQTCENTPGSYQCSCTTGFSLTFDGKNCEDLNECEGNPCSQECANIYGSYQCYCRVGFFLKEDGHTCEDIDECSQSIGNLCAFQCVNILGSYKCACPPTGYSMSPNGRTCQDIDECSTGTHNCSGSETCFNIQGGFRCLSFTCPENYRRVSDTRCERTSCPNFQQCQTMPLRITYYQLSFQTNIVIPAQIFRIGPSPAYAGDNIIISIPRGNEEAFFSTRKLNSFTGAVYLHRQVGEPRDFLIDVEMKLLRQGTFTTFLARIYVFITADSM